VLSGSVMEGRRTLSQSAAVVPLNRTERGKREKRERIIRAARELFLSKGFHATTTSEIAELADVAKGTLFFHANSKESLLVMMFQEELGKSIDRAFSKVPKAPLLEQLMHVFGIMLKENERNIGLARIFAKELAFVHGEDKGIDAVMATIFGKLDILIDAAKKREELPADIDSDLLAHNLFALYFTFMVRWLGSGEPTPENRNPPLRRILELHLRCART
jgi:AcrR family transcriptional regulator